MRKMIEEELKKKKQKNDFSDNIHCIIWGCSLSIHSQNSIIRMNILMGGDVTDLIEALRWLTMARGSLGQSKMVFAPLPESFTSSFIRIIIINIEMVEITDGILELIECKSWRLHFPYRFV